MKTKVSRWTFITCSWTEPCSCMAGSGEYHQSLTKHAQPGTALSLNQTSCWHLHSWAHVPKCHLSQASQEALLEQDWYGWESSSSRGQQLFPRKAFVVPSQLFISQSLITTGLFQKGHLEQLGTAQSDLLVLQIMSHGSEREGHGRGLT